MYLKPSYLRRAALLLVLLALFPAGLRAEELLLTPGLTVKEEYNDNISKALSDRRGDFVTTLAPSLSFSRRTERYGANLAAGLSQLEYLHNSSSGGTGYQLQGGGNYTLDPRLSLSASGGYSLDVHASSIDPATALSTSGSVHQQTVQFGGRYLVTELCNASLNLGYTRQGYDNPGYLTTRQYLGQAGLDYDLGRYWQGVKLGPQFGFTRDATSQSRVDSYKATLNLTKELHELWRVTLQGGGRYSHSEFQQTPALLGDGTHDEAGWVSSLSLAYAGEMLSGALALSHDLASASGRSGPTERNGGSLSLSEKFTRHLSGQLGLSYYRNRSGAEQFAVQRIDETSTTLNTGLRYELLNEVAHLHNLVLEAGYSYSRVDYRVTGARAQQNVFMLSLNWQHQMFR